MLAKNKRQITKIRRSQEESVAFPGIGPKGKTWAHSAPKMAVSAYIFSAFEGVFSNLG